MNSDIFTPSIQPMQAGDLVIRPWHPSDQKALFEAVSEPGGDLVQRVPAWTDPSRSKAQHWIEWSRFQNETGAGYAWSVWDSRGVLLGEVNVHSIHWERLTAQLGYWIRFSRSGEGVASAAIRRVARWAFSALGLQRLEIQVVKDNAASMRCAEKAGAVREVSFQGQGVAVFAMKQGVG